MLRILLLALVIFVITLNASAQQNSQKYFDGSTWWEHVRVLAADTMEGRETGSEGLRKAEAYVVDQLQKAGVQPAGVKGYYQPVKFESRQIVEKDSSAALVRNGKLESLVLGEDVFFNTHVDLVPELEASLAFAGYGLRIPEENYDDLAGLDLKGKVAVILTGSPEHIRSALSAHYQSTAERWKAFHGAGAVGLITIRNPASMDIPWSRFALNRTRPAMDLTDPRFNETAGEKLALNVNPEKAEKFFEGSGYSFQEIAQLGKNRKPMPHFSLPSAIKVRAKVVKKAVESANVIGKLPGSDPRLRDEYVVLSAHVDHLGIGEPVNGDRIYHGAMDNASGCAVLLDVAASLKKSGEKLKRSLLFVFVTGEEKGLLGSKYFTTEPTVDPRAMVADINIDMFLPIVPPKVLTVYGLAESDLGDMASEVARSYGLAVQPDPEPLRNGFIRSDQYNFIRHGIPALKMDVSFDPKSPEQRQMYKDWLTHRYHAPSDNLNQPVDLAAAAKYEDIVRSLMVKVADHVQRPQWKQDSFFRRYATGE